jgi:hypothetical protein
MSRTPSYDRKYAILLPANRVFAGALAVDEVGQPYPESTLINENQDCYL